MRNLLKLKLRAVLWTHFRFRHVLRYFQVFVKKNIAFFWHTLLDIICGKDTIDSRTINPRT